MLLLDLRNYKSDRDEPYTAGFVTVSNRGITYNLDSKTGRSFSIAYYSPSVILLDLSNYKSDRDETYTIRFVIV